MNDNESTSTEEGLLFTEAALVQLINHCKTEGKNSEALNNKVDKVEGKGLSTNDYTDAEKEKLAGLDNRVSTVENSLSDKVDKDGDKVLSTNDYTDAEKAKLEGLSNYDDTEISGRVTEAENALENKVDKVENKGLSTNDYTTKEKEELAKLFDHNTLMGIISNSAELNKDYTLGGGAKTNQGNDIKVKCVSIEDNIAMMQTYGVTAGEFPGFDLTESYRSYFGDLSSAINDIDLPSRDVIIENHTVVGKVLSPSVISEEVLKTAASNYELFGGESDGAWLAAGYPPSDVDLITSTGDYRSWESSHNLVIAPYFTLDLSKVIIKDEGVIELGPDNLDIIEVLKGFETKIKDGETSVSVEQKVSEGVNIASITIDGHTTELFAPEGGSSEPSTITIVNPNLYDTSVAVKGSGNDFNIYCEVSVSPNTDYVFDIQNSPYGWAGVRVGNTVIGNDEAARKLVEFNSGDNTTVRLQFFPGYETTAEQTDFSNILFYEAGKIPGETTTIENPNSGSGSNLVSTDITEILLTASSQHPIEIVLIGDSITEGYAATGSLSAGSTHPLPTWKNFPSWAGKLNSYITANFPNVTVTNRGYSGQVSAYGASNINSWITNNRQIAIVMFGTNNRTSQANMNSLANDYTTMLNRCKSVGAKMIPMCCIPTTPYNQSISGKYVGTMEQVHNILVNWAKTNGYELLDLYSLMMAYINNNTSNLESMGLIYVGSSDNNLHIHPSDAGHAVMFDFIKHKLGIGTAGGSGGAKYRHRVALYTTNGGTTYVIVNLYNNRSTPYNAATATTTDEINAFKADVLAAGYSSALQKGTLMCSGVIKGSQVYGMYMGTTSSGLSAVADKLNFINGTNFNITLPLETGGTNSASSSLRLWDTVEPA